MVHWYIFLYYDRIMVLEVLSMSSIKVRKYHVQNNTLKQFIRNFWIIKSSQYEKINHKLLPVSTPDIILNVGNPIVYNISGKNQQVGNVHVSTVKKTYCHIKQEGQLYVVGITFYPLGLYPLLKIPISEFTNKIIDANMIIPNITSELYDNVVTRKTNIHDMLYTLECKLLASFDFDLVASKRTKEIIASFESNSGMVLLKEVYSSYGINERWLQRLFQKFLGISPSTFLRLSKFHNLLYNFEHKGSSSLTDLSYQYNYADQSHLIKEFKYFCGNSPLKFRKDESWFKCYMKAM